MLTNEELNKAYNGFIHSHELILEYIYNDNEELYSRICKSVKRNENNIRLYLYNDIISKNRNHLSWIQENILNSWLDTFIDTEAIYKDIKNHLHEEIIK